MSKTLELIFQGQDKLISISVRNPKASLTATDIKTTMDAMISSNAFEGKLVSAKSARMVDRVTQDIALA